MTKRLSKTQVLIALVVGAFSFVNLVGCGSKMTSPETPVAQAPVNNVAQKATTFNFMPMAVSLNVPASELPLWALRGENTAAEARQMCFGEDQAINPGSIHGVVRLGSDVTSVEQYIDPKLAVKGSSDPKLAANWAIFEEAAVKWSRTYGRTMTLTTGGSAFKTQVGTTSSASTTYQQTASVIRAATTVFRSADDVNLVSVLHEWAHQAGMEHHRGFGMLGLHYDANNIDYSQAEKDNAAMMDKLEAGTQIPAAALSFVSGIQ
jgi:hypothetical protein